MFDEKDLQQIREHGLTPEQAETQLENFRRGFPFLNVVRAASPGDGVLVLDGAEVDAAVARYDAAVAGLRVVKFVPASGAATRMFKELFEFVNEGKRGKGIDVLLENIWGYGSESETRTVDVHIRTLRQKLGDGGALIETVRGVGYRMGGNA